MRINRSVKLMPTCGISFMFSKKKNEWAKRINNLDII